MSPATHQMDVWAARFGREYTDRNALSPSEMAELYEGNFGVTRTKLNERMIGHLDRATRILEVGCNVGNQLV